MKKSFFLLLCLICNVTLFAQEKIYIHQSNKISLGALIDQTDSVYFSKDGSKVYFRIGSQLAEYTVSEIDSISFGVNSNTISVIYNGTSASVINPLAFEGVSVVVKGADVIITSILTDKEINYSLKGTTSEGMFKIYSEYKFNLNLDGVSISNSDGPAINIQSGKKSNIILKEGTSNSLTDGTTYAKSTEDQKSTLFSEGQLEFEGTGNLTVKSISKHAICSDDYINIKSGTITVSGASKDGIHAKEYFNMSDGTLNITASGDGIESEGSAMISGGNITTLNAFDDVKGITCDSTMVISGGTINMTVKGNQSKGIKAAQNMTLNGGNITINTFGAAVLKALGSGYDPSYCSAIKCDSTITIGGADITITSTGVAGKGISSDKNINMTSGQLKITSSGTGTTYKNTKGTTDSYSAACLSSVNINIIGGTVTTSSSGAGGKGFKADTAIQIGDSNNSPTINITTSGAKFLVSSSGSGMNASTDYCHPKAIVSDGTVVTNNGNTIISSSDDGIHAETSYTQNNGSVTVNNSYEGVESYNITLNGGTLNVTASNDGMNATAGLVSGGTESNDNSSLNVKGGTLVVSCTNGDAIDSNGNIYISGGTTIANGPSSGVEEAADFNGSFVMSGGFFIGAGSSSNMSKAMSTTSTQVNMFISSSAMVSASTFLHIQNASGTDILTFKSKNGGYKFLFSSSALTKGSSYSIYTGGTYSGGTSSNGLYSGGTYSTSGSTLKKTVSLSSSSTVNSISF